MVLRLKSTILPLSMAIGLSLILTGCGRKGDFETPRPANAAIAGTKANPASSKKPVVEDRPFFLDPLL